MSAVSLTIQALLDDAGVTAIVGDRVQPHPVRQGTALPALAVTMSAENMEYLLGGASQYPESSVQVHCLGTAASMAIELGEAVKLALQDLSYTSSDTPPVHASFSKEPVDFMDFSDDLSTYRRVMSFGIRWRTTPVPAPPLEGTGLILAVDAGSYAITGRSATLGGVSTDIATTLETSVVHRGAEFFFDTAMPVGFYVDGQPFVVSTGAFNVIQITPDSVNVLSDSYNKYGTGVVGPTNYRANGTMVDPYLIYPNASPQGFDGLFGVSATGSGQNAARTDYSEALNVDPAVAGSYAVPAGAAHSLVKSIRTTGLTTPSPWQICENWCVLHIVPVVPPVGAFAPGASDLNKTSRFTLGMLDMDALGAGFTLSSGMPSLATCESGLYFPSSFLGFFGTGGDYQRRFHVDASGHADSGYSRDVGYDFADFIAAILQIGGAAVSTDRDQALYKALAYGITWYGLINRSAIDSPDNPAGGHGAGQSCGYKQFVQLLAHCFHATGPSDLIAKANAFDSNVTGQCFWVTEDLVGLLQTWPGNHEVYNHSFYDAHVGLPWWCTEVTRDENWNAIYNSAYSSENGSDYQSSSNPACFPELLNIMLLKAGPGGWDGSQVLAQHASDFTNTNPRAAPIAYFDRLANWVAGAPFGLANFKQARHQTYWDDRRGDCVADVWTGPPDGWAPNNDGSPGSLVFAVSGGFGWDLSTAPINGEAVTAYGIRYGIDRKSWVNVSSPAVSGTQTGLAIQPTFVQHRRQSASGWGPWSTNWPVEAFPITGSISGTTLTVTVTAGTLAVGRLLTAAALEDGTRITAQLTGTAGSTGTYTISKSYSLSSRTFYVGAERNVITTTGSPSAAAPVFTSVPVLWRKAYRVVSAHEWIDISDDTLTTTEASYGIESGTGYATGHPAPTYTFEKLRAGVSTGSPSSDASIIEEDGDVGELISCKVAATNASGSDTETTDTVTWRSLPAPGAAFVAKTFDTGEYLTRTGLIGVSDGMAFTLCVKFTPGAGLDGTARTLFVIKSNASTSNAVLVQRRTTNVLRISAFNAAGTEIFRKDISGFTYAGGEREVLFSYNSDVPAGCCYINGTDNYGTPTKATADAIANLATAFPTNCGAAGCPIKFLYFDDAFLDLSDATIRGKFATPMLLEANGAGPSGSAPAICFYSSTDDNEWLINRGSGGAFDLIT